MHEEPKLGRKFQNLLILAVVLTAGLVIYNQMQIAAISSSFGIPTSLNLVSGSASEHTKLLATSKDLSEVDITQITSTPKAVALLFPIENIKTEDDAFNMMLSSGAPEYSGQLGGITFDDPVLSMEYLAKLYPTVKQEVQQDPELWQRYLSLAAAPRGISCEFCCGVGPQGADDKGNLRCGCKHNPAVHALTLALIKNTDYTDAEILREVMRWKAMFFPKNMIGIALSLAGSDPSSLEDLPGMVGGC
ncbi:hypothetical protein HY501_00600 [Candidatus Woesearchaeota archaeon]|nr:hypothetical protein [Candidatus Woesearchaeota archaeon]